MQEKSFWSKKCPKCAHPALEHKHGKPEEDPRSMHMIDSPRYCHHPIEVDKEKEIYTFCLCEIGNDEYIRAGNHAMIRLSSKALTKKH